MSAPLLLLSAFLPLFLCSYSQFEFHHSFNSEQGCNGGGQLFKNDGLLYGWTQSGGKYGDGSGFRFTKDLGTIEKVINYQKEKTGYQPQHGTFLLNDKGLLLGTSSAGVNEGVFGGTIYSIDPSSKSSEYTTLFQFPQNLSGSDNGTTVMNGLTLGPNNRLYGVTTNGGEYWDSCSAQGFGGGTLFSFSNSGTDFQRIASFGSPLDDTDTICDCFASSGAPTFGSDGKTVYLSFRYGGMNSLGGVMAVNVYSGEVSNLFYFNETSGNTPQNPTLLFLDGALFGTTSEGGAENGGTLFTIQEDGSNFAILHTFCKEELCVDGAHPYDGVILGEDGRLYGMSRGGGSGGWGVLYRIDKNGENFEVLREFEESEGGKPVGLLTSSDGVLYGVLQEGGDEGCGGVFGLSYPISPFKVEKKTAAVVVVSVIGGLVLFLLIVTVCVRFERQRFAFIV